MDVYLLNVKKQYDNTEQSVQRLFQDIQDNISNQDELVFSHLVIDGTEVYENFDQYIADHLPRIQEIQVIAKTKQEMAGDLQQSLNEYLEQAIPSIEQLASQLYQGESEEVWSQFVYFTDGMNWIIDCLELLRHYSDPDTGKFYQESREKLALTSQELLGTVEVKDTVAIADIIQYEVVETLRQLQQSTNH